MERERGLCLTLKPCAPGRPNGSGRLLSPEEEKAVRKGLVGHTPDQFKMPFALWTREAVQQYIRVKCGFAMPIRTVGSYLQRWGFTPPKPVRRAPERNEKQVGQRLEMEHPLRHAA